MRLYLDFGCLLHLTVLNPLVHFLAPTKYLSCVSTLRKSEFNLFSFLFFPAWWGEPLWNLHSSLPPLLGSAEAVWFIKTGVGLFKNSILFSLGCSRTCSKRCRTWNASKSCLINLLIYCVTSFSASLHASLSIPLYTSVLAISVPSHSFLSLIVPSSHGRRGSDDTVAREAAGWGHSRLNAAVCVLFMCTHVLPDVCVFVCMLITGQRCAGPSAPLWFACFLGFELSSGRRFYCASFF